MYIDVDVDVFGEKRRGISRPVYVFDHCNVCPFFNCLFGKLLLFFSKKLRTTLEPGYV